MCLSLGNCFWRDQKQHIESSELERTIIHLNNNEKEDEKENIIHRDSSKQMDNYIEKDNTQEELSLFSEEVSLPSLSLEQIRIIRGEEKRKKKKNHTQLKTHQILQSSTAQRVVKKCMKTYNEGQA